MAELFQRPKIEVQVGIVLTEAEMRALYALTQYGVDSFLTVFYANLGKSCLEPHEEGIRQLFKSIIQHLPPVLDRADKARSVFNEAKR
jgi:hypothetical protein